VIKNLPLEHTSRKQLNKFKCLNVRISYF